MTTSKKELNKIIWTELNTQSLYFIQNLSGSAIEIIASDTTPDSSAFGHRIQNNEAVNQETFGDSKLWGRTLNSNTGLVLITE